MNHNKGKYKWLVLFLVVVTDMFVIAIPTMGMSVMAKEIAQDLHLNLVQVGLVWGIGSLPGIVAGLLGGAIGDKLGPKPVLILGTLLGGLCGAGRGLAGSFGVMIGFVLLIGALTPIVSMNGFKAVGQWFPSQQLGLANGIVSMGMALGFLIGSLTSATLLSPLLGGWRQVLILYGSISTLLCLPWVFIRVPGGIAAAPGVSILKNIAHVTRKREIWLLGLTLFGIGGCVQGVLGYLPLYLRGASWQPFAADSALSAFHTISMLCVLPIALWSDRLGSRKRLLAAAGILILAGAGLLSVADGWLIWAAVLLAGFVRDGFMAIFMTMVIETDGIGPTYAGTATGFTYAVSGVGNFLAPPLGNSLSALTPSTPFLFWSALAALGVICLSLVKRPAPHSLNERRAAQA